VSAPSTLGSALTWTSGPDSYSFTLSSSLVNAYCNSSGTTTTTINSGRLTEDSWVTKTGVSISHQVFNLPQLPAVGQTYNFNGGTVVLNTQNTVGAVTEVIGITVTTGAGTPQVLEVAVAGCESGGGPDGVANGDFTKGLSNWSPFVTGAGSATVSTGAGDEGENVANLTGGSPAGTESLSQQFIADGNFLTFDYKQTCGSGAGALTIVLNDATTGVNANLVGPARCTTDANWQSQFSFLTPGDTYTLTVTNSNTTGNITTTLFGDVRVGLF
jgi:hypothetical protein